MVKCNESCIPCCDFCIYAVHEEFEDKELGGTIHGGPIHCEKHPDEEHDRICESCGFCDDFHCFRADKEEKDRGYRRHSDWRHAKNKKNKSYYYCKDHPWYSNLHQYSKNKIHCSCPMCRAKTTNKKQLATWHKFKGKKNWTIKDQKRINEMKDQENEKWLENSQDLP